MFENISFYLITLSVAPSYRTRNCVRCAGCISIAIPIPISMSEKWKRELMKVRDNVSLANPNQFIFVYCLMFIYPTNERKGRQINNRQQFMRICVGHRMNKKKKEIERRWYNEKEEIHLTHCSYTYLERFLLVCRLGGNMLLHSKQMLYKT